MKAFKAYDIRGIYNHDFNKEDVYKIGFFLPELMETDKILVGRDMRVSSDEIFEYLSKGITDSGASVYDIGLATTPMVYYLTARHKFRASVQITASHNSSEYNGMKISGENAMPVGYENGLNRLEKMISTRQIVKAEKKGRIVSYDVQHEYIEFLTSYVPENLSSLKTGIDCSNGMAGLIIRDLLGDHPHYIYEKPDGHFPNHNPNPLDQENVIDLQNLVKSNHLDIGIIFDGDADRVMFVDEKGCFISPDLIIALMGHYFLKDKEGIVLEDIRTSKAVKEYIELMGGTMHTWKVGRAFAARKLKELDGIFGGELAGHYYFKDFYYSDSGILAALIVLKIVAEFKTQNLSFSHLMNRIRKYESSGEINFKIKHKKDAMEAVKDHFIQKNKPLEIMNFDGYRLEYLDWWFNIRPSNTEPYLRLIVEAKNKDTLEKVLGEIKNIIQQFK